MCFFLYESNQPQAGSPLTSKAHQTYLAIAAACKLQPLLTALILEVPHYLIIRKHVPCFYHVLVEFYLYTNANAAI